MLEVLLGLSFFTFVGSIFSTMFGVAGGAVLLFGLNLYFDLKPALGLHGVLQAIGGCGRIFIMWRFIRWRWVIPYVIGTAVGAYLSRYIIDAFPQEVWNILIGISFVTSPMWQNNKKLSGLNKDFLMVFGGFIGGFLGPVIGVVGFLSIPFFIWIGLEKEELVITKNLCVSVIHISKIILFWQDIVNVISSKDYLYIFLGLSAVTLFGAFVGAKLLDRMSTQRYSWLVQWIMVTLGAFFLLQGVVLLFK